MKKLLLFLILLVSLPTISQSLNDYQYVIVPVKFEVLKENDRYRMNTMTKLLLQKYGFKSYLSTDDIPQEVLNARCNALTASMEKESTMFVTKVKIVLKDCRENIVYQTEMGTSKEKEYAVAYNEALRAAFKSFDKANYVYNGKNDIGAVPVTPAVPNVPVVEVPTEKVEEAKSPANENNTEVFFFAQPIPNGFQIVDNEPKVIMRLYNSSQKNVFIGVKGDINGVVILKNNQWFFEYYKNDKLVSEPLKLKF
ncbi:hypothetical protein [Flavobacterium sp. XGLA_31]|uniref:hypothetical protein n=1 Tax=Flavobacterium sp. XGLA_31 TaxID=3447666 RepID=UPI003F39427E